MSGRVWLRCASVAALMIAALLVSLGGTEAQLGTPAAPQRTAAAPIRTAAAPPRTPAAPMKASAAPMKAPAQPPKGPGAGSRKGKPTPTPTATPTPAPTPETKIWNFDQDKAHQAAKGWTNVEGDWEVLPDPSAPSPPNTYGLGSGRLAKSLMYLLNYYPITVVSDATEYDDFTLEVDFKTTGGRLDCSGGLIFRYVDPKNYYVLSQGCPSDFFALNRVADGQLNTLKQQVVPTDKNTWYHIKVIAKEDHISCYSGDKFIYDVTDNKIRKGRVGLWALDDAQPRFDNLKLTLPLKEAPAFTAPAPAPLPGAEMPPAMPSGPGPGPGPGPGAPSSGMPPRLPPVTH